MGDFYDACLRFRIFGLLEFSFKIVVAGYPRSHCERLAHGEQNVPGWEGFDLRGSLEACFERQ